MAVACCWMHFLRHPRVVICFDEAEQFAAVALHELERPSNLNKGGRLVMALWRRFALWIHEMFPLSRFAWSGNRC